MALFADERVNYTPPTIFSSQIKAVEKAVVRSRDISDTTKKIIIFLLHKTNNLTKRVVLSLEDGWQNIDTKKLQDELSRMVSYAYNTHLDLIFQAMNTEMRLMSHYGIFEEKGSPINTRRPGITIWFSWMWYDHSPEIIVYPSYEEIDTINLEMIDRA